MKLRGDLLDFGDGHGFVGFVFEVKGAAIFGMVADEAVKEHNGAVASAADMSGESCGVYGRAHQLG